MKLKTVVCDWPFSKMLFFISDFYSRVTIQRTSAKTSFKISCLAETVFLYLERSFILSFTVKYLGLLAMSKILKTHPKSVQSHKDLILQCLDDKDESIRLRALDLLYGMVRSAFISSAAPWPFRKVMFKENMQLSLPTPQQAFDQTGVSQFRPCWKSPILKSIPLGVDDS